MPRLQVLIFGLLLPSASVACRIRATGRVQFESGSPHLIIFGGSLSETWLKLSPAPETDPEELLLHLRGARGRTVLVTGGCGAPPRSHRGEVFTDVTRVRVTLPDALRPNGGDELTVDPGPGGG